METIGLALAAAAGAAQPLASPAPRIITTAPVERIVPCGDLDWLAGAWRTVDRASSSGGFAEELWMPRAEGLMLGLGRTVGAPGRRSFEYMRIEWEKGGKIYLYASPEGGPAVPFRLVVCSPQWVTFENDEHDYPQHITYRREGDVLTASTATLSGSNRQTVRYERR